MRKVLVSIMSVIAAGSFGTAHSERLPQTLDCTEIVHVETVDDLTSFELAKDEKFHLTFSMLSEGEWVMTGNVGTVGLATMDGPGVIHFFESTPFGTINVTQIGLTPTDGKYKAVHSRHPVLLDEMFPSQWLLSCEAR